MRGLLSWGTYLPYRRLDRSTIAAVAGTGGGRGTRTVASYDEDTTTLGVEAARVAMRTAPVSPQRLWFTTTAPAYVDKTNATAIHAALRLDPTAGAYDAVGSVRSGVGALRAALESTSPTLVVAADVRTGLPGGPDEASGGDGAAAVLVGDSANGAVLAELIGSGSATSEFLDRWRTPGEQRSKLWEERFGQRMYEDAAGEAWTAALKDAGLVAADVEHLLVVGLHDRAVASVARRCGEGRPASTVADVLRKRVGNTGAAQPLLSLAATLDGAEPGQVIGLVVLADGVDVLLWRATDELAGHRSARPVAEQLAAGGPVPYGKYLSWRGWLPIEPPRRAEPNRPSASAAARSTDWKFGFVGSEREGGDIHLPPAPLDTTARPMAEERGTIKTFTIDRLAYSASPPIVFAVVDFEGGGRVPLEITDVEPDEVAIGDVVEMTFRRLFTADGVHNYFWKARPVRTGG